MRYLLEKYLHVRGVYRRNDETSQPLGETTAEPHDNNWE